MSSKRGRATGNQGEGQSRTGGRFSGVVKLGLTRVHSRSDRMTKGQFFGRLFADYSAERTRKLGSHSSASAQSNDKALAPKKVGIVGAGMAGLYAALLLQDFGIDYEILEANETRIGGRVYTHHFNNDHIRAKSGEPGYYNYVDLGAMRFPLIEIMDRVVGVQPWSLYNYLNSHLPADKQIKMIPYYLGVDNNLKLFNGIKMRSSEVDKLTKAGQDPLHFGVKHGGAVPDAYAAVPYDTWLSKAYDRYKNAMHQDFDTGFRDLMSVDYMSTAAYLRDFIDVDGKQQNYPFSVVNWCETLDSATGLYDEAFAESVMDSFDFDSSADGNTGLSPTSGWACVDGGTDKFSQGMTALLRNKPKLGKRINAIAYNPNALSKKMSVTLTDKTVRSYDHVICTLPPSVARTINMDSCNLSFDKRDALRCMHVDFAVKVNLLFTSRWWQDEKVMGTGQAIKGGQSSTDRPIRTCVYPSQAIDVPGAPGILMCSYAWAQDAARLTGLPETELLEVVLNDLTALHGDVVKQTFTGQYKVVDWYSEPGANGAFALYGAGQFSNLYPKLLHEECDSHLHFAGEAASVHHAWIVGALNSAYRTVAEILIADGRGDELKTLVEKWGKVEEVEFGLIQPFFNQAGSVAAVEKVKKDVKRKVKEVKEVAVAAGKAPPAKKQRA